MLIGYARVSTNDQTLNLQLDRLKAAGCEKIFTNHISGIRAERPGLADATNHLRSGDILVVWRLDRLGRFLRRLIDTITALEAQGIGFKSLQENPDTTRRQAKGTQPGKAEMARRMYADKHNSVTDICKALGIPRMTLWRYVRAGERKTDKITYHNHSTAKWGLPLEMVR